jgi:hypothetical protein
MRLHFSAKSSDLNSISVDDDDGKEIFDHQGYVPTGLGVGADDYVEFSVDVETGKIVGWDASKVRERIAALSKEHKEEE